jgi:hypothetical protein
MEALMYIGESVRAVVRLRHYMPHISQPPILVRNAGYKISTALMGQVQKFGWVLRSPASVAIAIDFATRIMTGTLRQSKSIPEIGCTAVPAQLMHSTSG